jgi:hypothetical protein
MFRGSKRRLYSQIGSDRYDVQLVRVRYTATPRFLWGVDATFQMKYTRHNVPHPAYFRFRRVHSCYYRKVGTGEDSYINKIAGRNQVMR